MGNIFKQQFSRIKGLSEKRRLPRLDRIRLGFKLKTKEGKEYPAELPFFLLPKEVAKIYGGKVTVERAKELGVTRKDVLKFIEENIYRLAEELEVMFPINDIDAVFPTAYKYYGSQKGLICMGDGEKALRLNEQTKIMEEIACPCENLRSDDSPKGDCIQRAHLLCLVPRVSMGGTYQITLSSVNSIIDINSGFDYVSAMIGRFALVPLKLRRIPTETHHNKQKQIHYTLQLLLDVPIDLLQSLRADTNRILLHTENQYALEAPKDENPAMDEEAVIQYVDEEENGQQIDITPVPLTEETKDEPAPEPVHETVVEPVDADADVKPGEVVWKEPFVLTEPAKEKTDMRKFLPLMAKELTRVGSARFFKILGNHGFSKPEELIDKDVASKVYKELLMIKMG